MTSKTPPTAASPPKSLPKAPTTIATRDRPPADGTVVLAVIVGAHGIAGEVRLKVFAEDVSAYRTFNGGALTLVSARHGGNGTIARFTEVRDRNAAEALRGTELTIPRTDLPPLADGEYYHADLIGLPVESTTGEAVGHVVAVENFGAGDVIEIERDTGRRFMVPMRAEAVPEWDRGRLRVDPAFID